MKKITLLTLSTFASFALLGCGGGSSTTQSNSNTGTGYYVDNAVAGVDYVCGTETGKTDKEGKFTFEKGQECKFSLAGIPLRTTSADKLNDGVKVVEDNPKVAQFLQSIDTDGDLSNGIEIDDKVLKALTDALANIDDDTTVLRNDTVLTTVVAEVGSQVEGVSGTVRTESEVQEHLTQTQTEITKELLAGKTFYVVVGITDPEKTPEIQKAEINQAVTEMTLTTNRGTKTLTLEIKGNKIAIVENDSDKVFNPVIQQDGFIQIDDKRANGDGHRLYASQSDAQAYFDSVKGETTTSGSATLSELIVGKTYYLALDDSYTDGNGNVVNNNHVETLSFNADGKTLTNTWIENGETQSHTLNYSIQGDTFNINGTSGGDGETVSETFKAPVTETNDYISFSGRDGRFYKTYAAAEAALESSDANGGNDSSASGDLEKLIVGKTVYKPDNNNGEKSITTFVFNQNMTKMTGNETYKFDIITTNDRFSFNNEGKKRIYKMVGSNSDYLDMNYLEDTTDRVKEQYRFYFDKSKAQSFLDTL